MDFVSWCKFLVCMRIGYLRDDGTLLLILAHCPGGNALQITFQWSGNRTMPSTQLRRRGRRIDTLSNPWLKVHHPYELKDASLCINPCLCYWSQTEPYLREWADQRKHFYYMSGHWREYQESTTTHKPNSPPCLLIKTFSIWIWILNLTQKNFKETYLFSSSSYVSPKLPIPTTQLSWPWLTRAQPAVSPHQVHHQHNTDEFSKSKFWLLRS